MLTETTKIYKLPLVNSAEGKVRANLEVSFVDRGYEEYFAVRGNIYEYRHRIPYSSGQNVDTIAELYPDNPTVQEIYSLWKKHHLHIRTNIEENDRRRIEELIGIA